MWNISDEFILETRPTMRDLVTNVWGQNLYDVRSDQFEEYVQKRIETVRKGVAYTMEMRLRDGRIIQFQMRPLSSATLNRRESPVADYWLRTKRRKTTFSAQPLVTGLFSENE